LHHAASKNRVEVVRLLVQAGIDTKVKTKEKKPKKSRTAAQMTDNEEIIAIIKAGKV